MGNDIILLYWGKLSSSDLNTMEIVKFMGRSIRPLQLNGEATRLGEHLKRAVTAGGSVISSAETLAEACTHSQTEMGLLRLVGDLAANVFVYGFEPTRRHGLLLRELTSGSIMGVEALRPGDSMFSIAGEPRELCRQFAGLSFGAADPDTDLAFVEGTKQSHCSTVIRIGNAPMMVRSRHRGCQFVLLSCREIADLDGMVTHNTSILRFFSRLVPLMMFVAATSADGCWHNDAPRANFIVDDPLLKRRYGFLDFQKLLQLMEREQFCTTIAFIPWNFRRSGREVARLFVQQPHRYSLCVHGCDHTRGEFGAADNGWLRAKAREALDRMTLHRQFSGVGFDEVMVFPQGIFSTAAMQALKACGYLAAVNSTAYPIDAGEGLRLRDLLGVAVTRFSNLPLFTRRSPEKLAELAFDLFLGKPALVVAHHGFFRDGYETLAEHIRKLHGLDRRLQWTNLTAICSHACLKRVAENGDVYVSFFTDRFWLRNETDRPQNYILARRTTPEDEAAVIIDGRPVDVSHEAEGVKARVSLGSGQAAEVQVESKRSEPATFPIRKNRVYNARVFIRRSLSEFRDNYLDRNRLLSRTARGLLGMKNNGYSGGS